MIVSYLDCRSWEIKSFFTKLKTFSIGFMSGEYWGRVTP